MLLLAIAIAPGIAISLFIYSMREYGRESWGPLILSFVLGMGFATVENIGYFWQFGMETGVSRFFLAVPAHASFAVLMGYNVGWAKFEPERSAWLMWKGLLIAVGLHGSFDFFLF